MNKKLLYPTLLIALSIGLWFSLRHGENKSSVITIVKTHDGSIEKHEINTEEIQQYKKIRPSYAKQPTVSRSPSSLNRHPIYQGREIIGDHPDLHKRLAINSFNEKWKDLLSFELMKFQSPGTKVVIEEEKELVLIKRKETRLVQQVVITYLNEIGRQSSYRAFIDSENGAVIQTWDRIIHEDIRAKPLTFTPSGRL
ncbi:MAG: hypothetical protein Fur0010_10270 [Bdellovibrio sp.]